MQTLPSILVAVMLAACQTTPPSASQSGSANPAAATVSGGPACLHGNHECSTDGQCCSGRCVQSGSATGICQR